MRVRRYVEVSPSAKESGFFYWKADLNVLLEQEYSVNTARLGISDEKLQKITSMSLPDAAQAIASHFNLSREVGRFRMRGC
jgi:hypothetical protein